MRKIVDSFTFFNELDLLEIRLKYLYDTVDYFVIISADSSFNGKPKQYVFKDHIERFAPYMDKIVYVPIKIKSFKEDKKVAWKREEYQRNCIKEGVSRIDLKETDLILISDIDEIPSKEVLIDLKNGQLDNIDIERKPRYLVILQAIFFLIKASFLKIFNRDVWKLNLEIKLRYLTIFKNYAAPYNFKMFNYYYYVNYQKLGKKWPGMQCLEFRLFNEFTTNEARAFRFSPLQTIVDGGWHFSYLGGKEMIKYKIKNFSHQEYNKPEILSDKYIDFCIENGYSLFDYYKHPNSKPQYVKKDISHLPKNLQNIMINYNELILN